MSEDVIKREKIGHTYRYTGWTNAWGRDMRAAGMNGVSRDRPVMKMHSVRSMYIIRYSLQAQAAR